MSSVSSPPTAPDIRPPCQREPVCISSGEKCAPLGQRSASLKRFLEKRRQRTEKRPALAALTSGPLLCCRNTNKNDGRFLRKHLKLNQGVSPSELFSLFLLMHFVLPRKRLAELQSVAAGNEGEGRAGAEREGTVPRLGRQWANGEG